MLIKAVILMGLGISQAQAPEPFQISVNVDLVVLQATVQNAKGGFCSGLEQQDFQVYEDGALQSIRLFRHEDIPVTVGLVVDHSRSMGPKLNEAIVAARRFVQASNPEDQMFVVNFNERVMPGFADATPFAKGDQLARAIAATPARGMTALYDAILTAHDRLRTGTWDKKVLVVISDGGDNASAHTLDQVLAAFEQSTALVYSVGIFDEDDPDRNPRVLQRLARTTGGEALFPRELSDLTAACDRIARDIRHQYTLGYVSSNAAKPGAHRTIRVQAHQAGRNRLTVRTRSGYIAGSP